MATNYDQTLQITINLNPVARSGETRAATTQIVDKTMFDMKRLIMENVAFFATQKQEKALKENIHRTFSTIVTKELARMGRQINQLVVGLNGSGAQSFSPNPKFTGSRGSRTGSQAASGPGGTLSLQGAISQAMSGQAAPVSLSSGTGPWPARSPTYLREKKTKVGHTKWFKYTGDLGRALADPATYFSAYGPMKVAYIPAPKGTALPTVVGVSSIGTGGRRTGRITIGRVEVSVLGRITTDMLNDPGGRQPSPWNTGLFGMLPTDVEEKLLNRQDAYRPFLEHFLSFYLTRAIPNAVFRQIEKVMANALPREAT